ncbi:MAG: hypothetical protein ACTHJ3_07655 [Pararhizobium sp.]
MKIKLLVSRSGPAGAFNAGDEIDVSADEATRMIAAEQAVPVSEQKMEKAVKRPAPEKRG